MERTLKTWGEKWNVFLNDLCEVSVLYLKPRRRCSWHKHQTKFNLFFVIEGVVGIKTRDGLAIVKKNQIFTTRPGELHEFQTFSLPSVLMEVMYVKYDAEDIQRLVVGGELALSVEFGEGDADEDETHS
jgi:mannose-6-phosphate isomerase-like protein (cupin superfamily)